MEASAQGATAPESHRESEKIPAGRWVERMIKIAEYESGFWDILTRGKLADLSQFHKPDVFEEVPLYTRYSELAFLNGQSTAIVNATVLRFALKFLNSVIAYQRHQSSYFAAITVWEPLGADDPIVPNLFFWSGNAERSRRLKKQLVLDQVASRFGKTIKKAVGVGTHPQFNVLEDRLTSPDESRIFISLAHRPYPSFMTLEDLRRPSKPKTSSAKSLNWSIANPQQGSMILPKKSGMKK